jgi:hypothetical protein
MMSETVLKLDEIVREYIYVMADAKFFNVRASVLVPPESINYLYRYVEVELPDGGVIIGANITEYFTRSSCFMCIDSVYPADQYNKFQEFSRRLPPGIKDDWCDMYIRTSKS